MAALSSSTDTLRMKLARVLVTKVVNESIRLKLIAKLAEPRGKLARSVVNKLIESEGILTPSLQKFLNVSISSAGTAAWKKFKSVKKK